MPTAGSGRQASGGEGNDRVGGVGNRLFAGEGTDFVLCGTGTDTAHAERADRTVPPAASRLPAFKYEVAVYLGQRHKGCGQGRVDDPRS